MTRIRDLLGYATDLTYFKDLGRYKDFCLAYLDFVEQGLQARVVCQNETHYQFFQYREECDYNITRPINTRLFGCLESFASKLVSFDQIFESLRARELPVDAFREDFLQVVYTLQQCIGATLDALPAAQANQAKKINGDLFERLVRLMFQEMRLDCETGAIQVPVKDDYGDELFKMHYQHDLIVREEGEIVLLGSVKTTSKDRIDKVFVDKLLFNRLVGKEIPHIAVFLNDVQRCKTKVPNQYKVNSTFLSGHFRAYTVRLVPMDGVFYCDARPSMKTDPFLTEHIKTIDHLFFSDLWRWLDKAKPKKSIPMTRGLRK